MRRWIPHTLAAAALLALPACSFNVQGLGPLPNFTPGPTPQSSVIYCDIEKMGAGFDHTSRLCYDAATPDLKASAISFTSAALALNSGESSSAALDKSPGAVNRCGADGEIVVFQGPFPQGRSQCLNCGADIPANYADANAACVAICEDISQAELADPTPPDVVTFCQNHAHASTNVPVSGCPMGFAGACTDAGTLRDDFIDPRMFPDPVVWTDLIGVAAGGTANNDLTQTSPTTLDPQSGAVSTQWVTSGDAYLEFSPAETNKTHVIGFSQLDSSAVPPDHDTDPTTADINFAFDLGNDGRVYILESGTLLPGPDIAQSWGPYSPGDRFRLKLLDRGDNTYDVAFSKIVGSCSPGSPCNEMQYVQLTPGASGQFRVDTAFHDQGATVQNVVLMMIRR